MFAEQAEEFKMAGFSVATIALEDLFRGAPEFYPALAKGKTVLYRGWMLSGHEYQLLTEAIIKAGAMPFTTLQQYLATHYIPKWYPKLFDLTPETVCFDQLDYIEQDLKELDWQGFFVKDFVKSLKTSVGSCIESSEQIGQLMMEMEKFRGQIEGGICVRRIEDIDQDSEQRYFVIKQRAYASRDEPIPEIILEGARRIESGFFSIDVVRRKDGVLRIMEIGDGQVSDIVGWSAERFVSLWSDVP